MMKQIKIICVTVLLIILMLSGVVNAFSSDAMCQSLLKALGIQEKVLYAEDDYLEIISDDIMYYEDTDQYDILLEVATTNIPDGTELIVTQEVYTDSNVPVEGILTFDVTHNTVNSNSADIHITTHGETKEVRRIKIIVTYIIDEATDEKESKHIEFEINTEPTLTIKNPSVESENLPTNVLQKITVPVETENIADGTILNVKLTQNGSDVDNAKYFITGNEVQSNMANVIINVGPYMTIGTYGVEISYEYEYVDVTLTVSDQTSFTIEYIPMNNIVIDQPSISLEVGERTVITYSIVPSTFTEDDLVFTSADSNIATIEPGGIVTAVGRGQTTLTISSKDNKIKATCQVNVFQPSAEIIETIITPEKLKQGEQGNINIKVKTADLANGKALDVSIQKHGLDVTEYFTITGNEIQSNEVNLNIAPDITSVTSGEYTVLISFDGKTIESENVAKQSAIFKIEGNVVVTGITLNKTNTNMIPEATRQIVATLTPENAENKTVVWKTSNPDVVTVDENGVITAEGMGKALITVWSDENPEIYATVNVVVQEIVETEEYTIDREQRIIKYIPENTSLEILKENVRFGADEYTIVNKKGSNLNNSDLVGTDTKITIEGEEYKLIIIGDTNGDGKISVTDVSKLKMHIVELEILTDCAEIGADMNRDSNITPTDLSRMKLYLVGLE